MYKVAIISGSRADYSLLYPVIMQFKHDARLDLRLIATGCESSNAQSLSEIFQLDGLHRFAEISSGPSDGSSASVCHAIANTVNGFSALFSTFRPDLMLVLGDRYEIFAAVQTAWIYQIPVAHIAGGDVTEGAIDEGFRHAISKMSSLHFTTNNDARSRVLQLGENAEHVHMVGSPGIDNLVNSKRLSRDELSESLKIPRLKTAKNIYLITLHPETLSSLSPSAQVSCVIEALGNLDQDSLVIISAANTDPGGEQINSAFRDYCQTRQNAVFVENLGRLAYVSLLAMANVMIGNSSSGIYEAPTFKLPVVNIGNRQAGRLMARNIINCEFDTQAIVEAIRNSETLDCQTCENPFGDGKSAKRIHDITVDYLDSPASKDRHKSFQSYNLGDVK